MKDVDVLLKRARMLATAIDNGEFTDDEDGFLEALGVDKSKYEVRHKDGTMGYDFLAALNDLAKEVWD